MRKIDLDVGSFICVSAIEAVAHNAVLNQAEMLPGKMVRTLVDETTAASRFAVEDANAGHVRRDCTPPWS
jgi:hypothetical protein